MSKNFAISIAIAMVMSVAAVTTVSAQNVKENADGTVTITLADGTVKTFQQKKLSELTDAEMQAIIKGEKAAYDKKVVGLDGKNRRRTMAEAKVGAHYTDGSVAPMGDVCVAVDVTPSIALVGEVEISSNQYGPYANREGSYPVIGGFGGFEVYVIKSVQAKYTRDGSRAGFGIKGGFLKGMTNDLSDEKVAGSEGLAGALKVYLKGQLHINKRCYLVGEAGMRWGGHFQTDAAGNWQQKFFDKGTGAYAEVGVGIEL